MRSPKIETPVEDPAVKSLRRRQIEELADLDEEENQRLKQAFRVSRGFRSFQRVPTSGNATAQSAAAGRVSVPNSGGFRGRAGGPGGDNGRFARAR